ncbi:MoaD/ThiS family protein [Legionella fallonii]|uniref:ThiS family n=1 Tax=Legionella fallonii LLAP-10 TaxID=1212491 RepID=A0A098FZU1_9GAMM|nr:MoaD/ThiS family protein [Legionella fallonii]CEG55748.1 ThiS family [Legionella fallonii LLAP-10]
MAKVNVHSSLVRFTDNQNQLELPIDNTSQLIPLLCQYYEKLRANILDSDGALTPYVNIYVNGKNLNQLQDIPISENDNIDIVTALVGG